jgi:hypothetical protein
MLLESERDIIKKYLNTDESKQELNQSDLILWKKLQKEPVHIRLHGKPSKNSVVLSSFSKTHEALRKIDQLDKFKESQPKQHL